MTKTGDDDGIARAPGDLRRAARRRGRFSPSHGTSASAPEPEGRGPGRRGL